MRSPIAACRAGEDYSLWIQFADGLQGSVNVANLLDIGTFKHWRDLRILLSLHGSRTRAATSAAPRARRSASMKIFRTARARISLARVRKL